MKKIIAFLALAGILFQSGCGLIAAVGSPTPHEQKVQAEYDLTERKEEKMLVLVNQPRWVGASANLRYYLTKAIHKNLTGRIEIESENLVSYNELSEFRSKRPDFSLLSSQEVGTALGAGIVLVVMIEDYQLNTIPEVNYYEGFLNARAALFDTAGGKKLWPESAGSKRIKVGFDIESLGRQVAISRLAGALAHCTIRYLYNCPKNKFKIAEDRSGINWED